MLLSKLAYLAVKNAIYYANPEFNYEAFTRGDFDNDDDYALNINNVFSPINEAIARLSDLDKLPHIVTLATSTEDGYVIDLSNINFSKYDKVAGVKEVIAIGDTNYKKLAHKPFGVGKVLIERPCSQVYVEFKPDLPLFSKEDLGAVDLVSGEYTDSNIELKEFGLSDSVCNYIMEYAQGRLMEPIAPELANMHITRAETYFANLKSEKSAFSQDKVESAYSGVKPVYDSDGFRIN